MTLTTELAGDSAEFRRALRLERARLGSLRLHGGRLGIPKAGLNVPVLYRMQISQDDFTGCCVGWARGLRRRFSFRIAREAGL